jgi:glycosyltransferase involved in cell wall biosynthesis
MALSKPLVASNVDSLPEIVEHEKSGLLVAAENEQALAEALCRALSDKSYAQRLGAAARERVHHLFGFDAFLDTTRSLYSRLLERAPDGCYAKTTYYTGNKDDQPRITRITRMG